MTTFNYKKLPTKLGVVWKYRTTASSFVQIFKITDVKVRPTLTTLDVSVLLRNDESLHTRQLIDSTGVRIAWLRGLGEVKKPYHMLLLPFVNNMTWKIEAETSPASWASTAVAIGFEKVTTPVGTFDTVCVTIKSEGSDGTSSHWFADSVGEVQTKKDGVTRTLIEFVNG